MIVSYNLAILNVVGPFCAAALGALLLGDEYLYRTIRLLWTAGPSRLAVLVSKVLALTAVFAAGTVFFCAVGAALSMVLHWLYPIPWVNATGLAWPRWLALSGTQWLITMVSLLLWARLAGAVAALARNRFAGVLAGIGYPIAEALVLNPWPWPLRQFLPLWNQKSTLPVAFNQVAGGGISFDLLPGMVPLATGLAVSALYIAALIGLLSRRG